MRKDILLCFLSDVKLRGMQISPAVYQNIGEKKECHATNESAVRYLLSGENALQGALSHIFLVRTKMVAGNIKYKTEDAPCDEEDGNGRRWIYYRDAQGRAWTHYDYFLHRIEDIVPQAQEIAESIDFDENAPIEANMDTLIDVASHVRKYAQTVRRSDPDAQIFLHVDCTGGMRNASMILVALMRLLQYERISIGKVLYSDFQKKIVEEANPLYSFFDLVAGAEEFVRHGEVSVLQDYFRGREKSPALERLLAAMNRFAEELTLCRYGELREAILELRTSIENFSMESTVPLDGARSAAERSDELMRQMLARIREDYRTILTDEMDDIALIRWCVGRGFMQQSMTFFTERVPELLLEEGFLWVHPPFEDDFLKKHRNDSMRRGKGFYLVNDYGKKDEDSGALNLARNKWKSRFRQFVQSLRKGVTEDDIQTIVNTPLQGERVFQLSNAERLQDILLWLRQMLRSDGCDNLRETEVGRFFLERVGTLYLEEKIQKESPTGEMAENQIHHLRERLFSQKDSVLVGQLLKFLGARMTDKMLNELFSDIEWNLAEQRVSSGFFIVKDEVLAKQVLTHYFAIKDERNHTSHARAETGRMSVAELKAKICDALEYVERACREEGRAS